MNAMELLSSPVAYRLGWTLVHSLWEVAAVGVLAWAALALLRRRSPQVRYAAATGALAAILVLTVATFLAIHAPPEKALPVASAPSAPAAPPMTLTPPSGPQVSTALEPADPPAAIASPSPIFPAEAWTARWQRIVEPYLPWLVAAWLAGVLALSLWRMGGWVAAYRLRSIGTQPVGPAVQAMAARLIRRMGLGRPVRVLQSLVVQTPMVIGWLRPVVLLPVAAVAGLTPDQLEAILAHELAHIRRLDYLLNLVQALIEVVLFYHPAVWWIARRIRAERERCCDDVAVGVLGNPIRYVEALAAVSDIGPPPHESRRRPSASRAAVAASGSDGRDLVDRVRRLLAMPESDHGVRAGWLAGMLAAAILVAGLIVLLSAGKVSGSDSLDALRKGDLVERDGAAEALLQRIEKGAIASDEVRGTYAILCQRLMPVVEKLRYGNEVPSEAISHYEYRLLWKLATNKLLAADQESALLNALAPAWIEYSPPNTGPGAPGQIKLSDEMLRPPAGIMVHRVIRMAEATAGQDLLEVFAAQREDAIPQSHNTSVPITRLADSTALEVATTWYVVPERLAQDLPSQVFSGQPEALQQMRQFVARPDVRKLSQYQQTVNLARDRKWRVDLLDAPPAAPGTATRQYGSVKLFINNHRYGPTNGLTGDAGPTGKATCGHPGHVSEVSWHFLRPTPQGDIYEFTRVYPSDTATPATSRATVTYKGAPLVVFEDDIQKVVLRPASPEETARAKAFAKPAVANEGDAWALILTGEAAIPRIVDMMDSSFDFKNPNEDGHSDPSSMLVRAYLGHWQDIPQPLDQRIIGAIRHKVERDAYWGSSLARAAGIKVLALAGQPYQPLNPRETVEEFLTTLASGNETDINRQLAMHRWHGYETSSDEFVKRARAGRLKADSLVIYASQYDAFGWIQDPDAADEGGFCIRLHFRALTAWRIVETLPGYARSMWTGLTLPSELHNNPSAKLVPPYAWGAAVEGVQVRLRAEKAQWKAGETPTFAADIRNQGPRENLAVVESYAFLQLQVDGQWYRPENPPGGILKPLVPQTMSQASVPLSQSWYRIGPDQLGPRPQGFTTANPKTYLELSAGKHVVRVGAVVEETKANAGGPIWAVSNPVEIEILPAEAKPAAPAPKAPETKPAATAQTGTM